MVHPRWWFNRYLTTIFVGSILPLKSAVGGRGSSTSERNLKCPFRHRMGIGSKAVASCGDYDAVLRVKQSFPIRRNVYKAYWTGRCSSSTVMQIMAPFCHTRTILPEVGEVEVSVIRKPTSPTLRPIFSISSVANSVRKIEKDFRFLTLTVLTRPMTRGSLDVSLTPYALLSKSLLAILTYQERV